MNASALLDLALIVLVGGVVFIGCAVVLVLRHRSGVPQPDANPVAPPPPEAEAAEIPAVPTGQPRRPAIWLAIRSRDTAAIQRALGLNNPAPCSWAEGLVAAQKLFIAPPVNGWTLVFGSALPDPGDDADVTYHFLRELSRKLGQVQLFQADLLLQHHAWALVESGRIVRAYAWAGATVWNQGVKTAAEITLGVKCYGYAETPVLDDWAAADFLVANVQKVPLIARRWSLDPAEIDLRALPSADGIAGERGAGN